MSFLLAPDSRHVSISALAIGRISCRRAPAIKMHAAGNVFPDASRVRGERTGAPKRAAATLRRLIRNYKLLLT